MKKLIFLILNIAVAVILLCSCGSAGLKDDGRIKVVCTSFAPYDWAKNIIKDSENVNLVLLNTKGTDMHSYEPSADDIISVDSCHILIAVGGEADSWALDAVPDNGEATVINLLELAEASGNYGELHSHEHTEVCESDHNHSSEAADEHIWMSVKNAAFFTEKIAEALCSKDSDNAELYTSNAENYVNQLAELDGKFADAAEKSEKPVIVVADRFPFMYLTDDYGIECFAAFPGCSADTDASPDTVIRLARAVDEHNLGFVAVTENTTGKTARAVVENTADKNQKTVVIDSMQAVSMQEIENGATYIGIMEQNLEAIKTLLG